MRAASSKQLAAERHGNITIVRAKNKWAKPAAGGWCCGQIYFYFADDPDRHICELQVVDARMQRQRKSIPNQAYDKYARNRCFRELLCVIDKQDSLAAEAAARALQVVEEAARAAASEQARAAEVAAAEEVRAAAAEEALVAAEEAARVALEEQVLVATEEAERVVSEEAVCAAVEAAAYEAASNAANEQSCHAMVSLLADGACGVIAALMVATWIKAKMR